MFLTQALDSTSPKVELVNSIEVTAVARLELCCWSK